MKKILLGALMLLALSSPAYAQEVTQKFPLQFNFELGMGSVSATSKTDERVKSTGNPTAIFGGNLTANRSNIALKLERGLDNLFTGRAIEIKGRQHGFSIKNISIGITGYYFYGKETDTFRINTGYIAQTLVRKHAINLGPDILYGSLRGKYVRGAYSIGAMYLQKDGVFTYNNLDEPVVKLGDWDFVPAGTLTVEGKLPVWRLEFTGSARSMRTLNIADRANTKGLIPFRHTVVDTSMYIRTWKRLGISVSNTYTDNNYGTAFLGNTNRITLVIKK